MIPQNIKSAIDKYKSRIPTDEELTALFDLVNSAKLKGRQQEEVWEYFETVQKEAEASIKAKEQEILDKQQKQAQEDRARRIQQAKLASRKKKEKEERMDTLFCIGLSVLLSCGGMFGTDMSMAAKLICIGIAGTMVTLVCAFTERDQKKVAYRLLWVTLFYVILGVIGFFMVDESNDKSVTETEKVCNVNINRDSIDIEGLRNVLINTFGQDLPPQYSFDIEAPEAGHMRLDDKDVYVYITVTENSTQKKGSLFVIPSSEGATEVVKTADVASMSCGYKISDAISEWVEKNIR